MTIEKYLYESSSQICFTLLKCELGLCNLGQNRWIAVSSDKLMIVYHAYSSNKVPINYFLHAFLIMFIKRISINLIESKEK